MKRNISPNSISVLWSRYGVLLMFCTFVLGLVVIFYLNESRSRIDTCDTVYDLLTTGSGNKYAQTLFRRFGYSSGSGLSLDLPYERARFDDQRLIRIYDFIRVGNRWEILLDKYDVCLTTQTSIERLYWVPQVLETWDGPLSLAILVVNEEEWLTLNLYSIFLERCFPSFRDQVTIHLAVPVFAGSFYFTKEKLHGWNVASLARQALERNCSESEPFLNELLNNFSIPTVKDKDKLALKIVYPQNHLRNIARKGCATHWTLSTDVDIIPCQGMADKLQQFYDQLRTSDKHCKKCAFVIPTFELDEKKPFPKGKSEMVEYVKIGAGRQYHGKDYDLAQTATDYQRWLKTNIEEGPTKVSHKIKQDSGTLRAYEPFYVSSGKIPPFDERFLGYGRTRSSQFQEAILAGWNFTVLTPVFSVHWGLHNPSRSQSLTVGGRIRNNQTVQNRYLFEKIVKEMKLRKKEGLYK